MGVHHHDLLGTFRRVLSLPHRCFIAAPSLLHRFGCRSLLEIKHPHSLLPPQLSSTISIQTFYATKRSCADLQKSYFVLLQTIVQPTAFPLRKLPHLRRVPLSPPPVDETVAVLSATKGRILGFPFCCRCPFLAPSKEKGEIKPPVFEAC